MGAPCSLRQLAAASRVLTDSRPPLRRRTGATLGRVLPVANLLLMAVICQAQTERPQPVFDRAVADFQAGRISESVSGFDRLAKLVPDAVPQLWQRGVALYYAGRYQDCRAQFESHRTVNPNDVENSAWHFLCVARGESPAHS